jgi:kynurenine formamidase
MGGRQTKPGQAPPGAAPAVPGYGDLPKTEAGLPHAWDVFGPGDELGTLNRITPNVTRAAVAAVRTGESIGLNLPLDEPNPPLFGRGRPNHRILEMAPGVQDDVLDGLYLQGSTQWDGFRHRRDAAGFYGRVDAATAGGPSPVLGVGAWTRRGIVTRIVLADVAAAGVIPGPDAGPGRPIPPAGIQATLEREGVTLRPGDILAVRTGWMAEYQRADAEGRHRLAGADECAGLEASDAMAAYLWDAGVAAVLADNPALEFSPRPVGQPPLHARLLPLLGMPIGELFDLEAWAAACGRDGRYDALFCSMPLNLPAGVGSPANAMVVR